jgi:hypothetical protein
MHGDALALGWRRGLAEEMRLGVAVLLAVFVFLRSGSMAGGLRTAGGRLAAPAARGLAAAQGRAS